MNSIYIGDFITKHLSINETYNKVFPIVAENGVTQPFITYHRTNLSNIVNKDGYIEDEITFKINVVSESYSEGIEIANNVINTFKIKQYKEENYTITNLKLISADERYSNGSFIQELTFTCTFQNI